MLIDVIVNKILLKKIMNFLLKNLLILFFFKLNWFFIVSYFLGRSKKNIEVKVLFNKYTEKSKKIDEIDENLPYFPLEWIDSEKHIDKKDIENNEFFIPINFITVNKFENSFIIKGLFDAKLSEQVFIISFQNANFNWFRHFCWVIDIIDEEEGVVELGALNKLDLLCKMNVDVEEIIIQGYLLKKNHVYLNFNNLNKYRTCLVTLISRFTNCIYIIWNSKWTLLLNEIVKLYIRDKKGFVVAYFGQVKKILLRDDKFIDKTRNNLFFKVIISIYGDLDNIEGLIEVKFDKYITTDVFAIVVTAEKKVVF